MAYRASNAQTIVQWIFIVAIILLAVGIVYQLFFSARKRNPRKLENFESAIKRLDNDCADDLIKGYFQQVDTDAKSLATNKAWEVANNKLDSATTEIREQYNPICSLLTAMRVIPVSQDTCEERRSLETQFQSLLDSARLELNARKYEAARARLRRAEGEKATMLAYRCITPPEPPIVQQIVETPKKWARPVSEVEKYRTKVNRLGEGSTRDSAKTFLEQLIQACNEGDSSGYVSARQRLLAILPPPPPPQDSSRIILAQVKDSLAAIKNRLVSEGIYDDLSKCLKPTEDEIAQTESFVAQGNSTKAQWHARMARTKAMEFGDCEEAKIKLNALMSDPNVDENCKNKVAAALSACDCQTALAELQEPDCKHPTRPSEIDFESLYKIYLDGDYNVWMQMKKIDKSDRNYALSRKYIVLCLARFGKFEPNRKEILEAFKVAWSVGIIDTKNDVENAICYSAAAICYGLNDKNRDCDRAVKFFDMAYGMGTLGEQFGSWWLALYVSAKCACDQLRSAAKAAKIEKQQLKDKIREFLEFEDRKLPHHDEGKYNEMKACKNL